LRISLIDLGRITLREDSKPPDEAAYSFKIMAFCLSPERAENLNLHGKLANPANL
jgi:hypothetical protein